MTRVRSLIQPRQTFHHLSGCVVKLSISVVRQELLEKLPWRLARERTPLFAAPTIRGRESPMIPGRTAGHHIGEASHEENLDPRKPRDTKSSQSARRS